MANLNKVMLIGNLTRDPETRHTPKGSAVCDLSLAVNRTYVTDSGEKMQEVTYVDITLWGKQAESAGQYLHKGRAVFIEGRLQMDTWEDKQTGQKRSRLKVLGDAIQFLSGPKEGGSEGYGQQRQPRREQPAAGGYGQQQRPPQRAMQRNEWESSSSDGQGDDAGMGEDEIPF
jgi:single-strand DNA-binding protein